MFITLCFFKFWVFNPLSYVTHSVHRKKMNYVERYSRGIRQINHGINPNKSRRGRCSVEDNTQIGILCTNRHLNNPILKYRNTKTIYNDLTGRWSLYIELNKDSP